MRMRQTDNVRGLQERVEKNNDKRGRQGEWAIVKIVREMLTVIESEREASRERDRENEN